jgi:hypothetical protein
MTDEKSVISQTNTLTPEVLPADVQEEGNAEEQREKARIEVVTEDKNINITDPQEKMEGPLSSIIQKIKESGKDNDNESKEEANKRKDENI